MKGRTQWTLVGSVLVLGWGAGVTRAVVGLNDAAAPSTFGSAVTLDTAPREGAGVSERSAVATQPPRARSAAKPDSRDSPVSQPARKSAPRAVPAPPPRQAGTAQRAPAVDSSDASDASDASADSAESANSAD